MRARILLALATTLALSGLSGLSAAADPLRDPWAGFQPGSFVHQRTTTKTGLPESKETVTESRTTLVKAAQGVVTLRSEFRVAGGEWNGQEITMDAAAAGAAQTGRPEVLGEEKLTVDGHELVCRKQRTVLEGTTTVSWVHPDYGVVRSESTGTGGAQTRLALEKLAVRVKAGKEEVDCRQLVTVTSTAVGTSTTTMWLSPAVPGGVVRSETWTVQGRARLTMVTETLEYAAKR